MKFAIAFLALMTAVFAEEITPSPIGLPQPNDSDFKPFASSSAKRSFFFLMLNVTETSPETPFPGFGGGYRYEDNADAIDFSASFSHKKEYFIYTAPKISYHRFLHPIANNSFYYGGGLGWGGLEVWGKKERVTHVDGDNVWKSSVRQRRYFHGLVPSINIGYEMNRHRSWRSFAQLDVSQPLVAAYHEGPFPGPYGEFSVGIGF